MSKIEWTGETWNPIVGCTKVSPGCANCYAERMSGRLANMAVADESLNQNPGCKDHYKSVVMASGTGLHYRAIARWNGQTRFVDSALDKPLKRKKPTMYFVCSMSDLFHENNPDEWIDRVFAVMALCPQHTFQVLTKRPKRMEAYLTHAEDVAPMVTARGGKKVRAPFPFSNKVTRQEKILRASVEIQTDATRFRNPCGIDGWWPLPNVWLGTSIEDQQRADERIPHLLRCPASVRFLSCEPLLGPVDLAKWIGYNPLHEPNTQRRGGLRSGQDGLDGSSTGRVGVENEVSTPQPMELRACNHGSQPPTSDRRADGGRLQTSQGDDGPKAGELPCSPSSLASSSRTNSSWQTDQSHQRRQSGQSPVQPRVDRREREPEARTQDGLVKPDGNQEQPQSVQPNGCRSDQDGVYGGSRDAGGHCQEVRRQPSDNIKDCEGRSDAMRAGADGGLHETQSKGRRESSISLVICGGESGPGARPCNVEWIRDIVRQCKAAGVPVFVKQLGSKPCGFAQWPDHPENEGHGCEFGNHKLNDPKGGDLNEWPEDLRVREMPKAVDGTADEHG